MSEDTANQEQKEAIQCILYVKGRQSHKLSPTAEPWKEVNFEGVATASQPRLVFM